MTEEHKQILGLEESDIIPIDLTADVTGVLPVANGGTGSATEKYVQKVGDSMSGALSITMPLDNGSSAFSVRGDGGGIVTLNALDNGQIELYQALRTIYGGTGLGSYTQGDLIYSSAANTLSNLAKSTTATHYLSNTGTSNNPAWAQVSLSTGVSGTLPIASGGTAATAYGASRIIHMNSGNTAMSSTANFTISATGATLYNSWVGDVGHGAPYAGFSHPSAATSTKYGFLGDSDGGSYFNCFTGRFISFRQANSSKGAFSANGLYLGGDVAGTARLHIAAGSTTANTAPLKFTSGSLNTTAEAGAIEFLTDKLYFTITTSAVRKEITLNDAALTSGRVPFATTNGRLTDDADFTFATDTLTVTKIAATTFTGNVTLSTVNLVTDTTTGTKIGTGTTQKIGFYNSTPVVQQSSTGETAGWSGGTGAAVSVDDTFDGNMGTVAYTISDIVKHLKTIGLIAT